MLTEPALYPPTVKYHTGLTCYLSYKDIPFLSTNNNIASVYCIFALVLLRDL